MVCHRGDYAALRGRGNGNVNVPHPHGARAEALAFHHGRNGTVAHALVGGQGAGADLGIDLHRAQGQVAIHLAGALRVGSQTAREGHQGVVHRKGLDGARSVTAGVLASSSSVGVLPGFERQGGGEGRRRSRGHTAGAGGLGGRSDLSRSHAGEGEGSDDAESEESGFQGTEERVHGELL